MKTSSASSLRLLPEIGLVDVADPSLSERLRLPQSLLK
jgi:hypothetical protein